MLRPRPTPVMLRRNKPVMGSRSFPAHLDSGEPVLGRPVGRHDAGRMRAGIAVLDDWHGKGLARLLLTGVLTDARRACI